MNSWWTTYPFVETSFLVLFVGEEETSFYVPCADVEPSRAASENSGLPAREMTNP